MTAPLCSNRPEGFGPHSSIHPSLPTTCFTDTVLIPLATYTVLAAIAAHFLAAAIHPLNPPSYNAQPPPFRQRGLVRRICTVLYWILLVCELAMFALETARLSAAHLGVGLLPFMFAGILIVGPVKTVWTRQRYWMQWVALGFWVMLVVLGAVGAAVLADELNTISTAPPRTAYPVADELTDRAVYVAVAALLVILEVVEVTGARKGK